MDEEKIYRIGDKVVSLGRVVRLVKKILELRERGLSQQETAGRLNIDRTLVSRLESLGEVRKGGRVAVIGFPIANSEELAAICIAYGLDFYLLLNNRERWEMVRGKQALDFFNQVLELVARLREFDTLILITSDKWYHLAEALVDRQIIFLQLGRTPLEADCPVDGKRFEGILQEVLK